MLYEPSCEGAKVGASAISSSISDPTPESSGALAGTCASILPPEPVTPRVRDTGGMSVVEELVAGGLNQLWTLTHYRGRRLRGL